MKFLVDQDVYASTIRLLRDSGHDVVTAANLTMSRSLDSKLLEVAHADSRLFVTRDRDFGNLVFVQNFQAGVLYLRMTPAAIAAVHTELIHVLDTYGDVELQSAFVVVEAGRHRFRRIPPNVNPSAASQSP